MSVEISGPKGYEFQYLITAYMAISNLREKNLKVIVEKEDGEDFEISFERENKSYIIECQVKSTTDDLSLRKLVSWLHHFADNSGNNNLISRIENDENRYALFITKGRCTDETKCFISKQLVAHNDAPLKRSEINNYLGHISTLFTGSTKLQKERREYSELQKEKFNNNRPLLTSLLRKTFIHENIDEVNIIEETYKTLKLKFNIPIVKCEVVLLKILEAVRKARSHRGDVVPEVIEIIETNKVNVISTGEVNIERDLESTLLGKIKENNYLLLTGISFCGKTHMARQIAKKYQQHGYHYKEVSDVNDAKRFLLEESSEERLCIVEDPLGHTKLKEEASEIWSQLADLITKINSNRLIIITSKIEMIKEFNGTERLEDCSLEGGEWTDLTVTDKEFLLKVWKGYLDYNGLSEDIFERIRGIIKNQDKTHLLQPGQIRYLSLQGFDEQLNYYTDDEIIRIATIDAQKIGNYFNSLSENYKLVIYVLGLGATTLDSINIRELSYILGDMEEYPSSKWEDSPGFSEIEFDNESIDFPVYSSELLLEDGYYDTLYYLETKGYIKSQDENYVFSHPTFQYAAQYILSRPRGRSQEKRLLEVIKKGISCLDDRIAINFINKFEYLYGNCRREIPKSLTKYAERSLRSIFPAVRDEALIFLLKIFESLNSETQKEIHKYLQRKSSPEDNIKWNEGKPWILEKTHYNLSDMKNFLIQKMPVPEEEYNRIKEKVAVESLYQISVEDIWNFVKSIERFTDNISEDVHLLIKVFKTNEAFIRANIAKILMENFGNDKEFSEIVLNDPHPTVLYQGVRGIFIGWKNFDEQSKLFLVSKLEELFNDSSVSIVSIHFMLDFGDDHGFDSIHPHELSDSERVDVWNLWAKLFSVIFRSISTSIYLNDSHLYNTVMQASKIIEIPNFIPIIDAWLVWIEKNIGNKKLLSGSALGIARPLLKNTDNNYKAREHISEKLLSCEDTNFIAITLSEYVNNWDLLSETEKEIIIRLFENDKRVDKEWLKAISLTRRYVPTEIQKVITGEDILNKDPQQIIANMDDQLLLRCLNIYLGYPQPLWWIGTHHEIDTPWSDIIITLLIENKTEHPGYIIALRNFIEKYSLNNYPNKNKQDAIKIWKEICENSNLYDEIFELLLMWSRKIVGVNVIGLWEIFFELCPVKKEEEYLSIIAENAVILNDRNQLYEIFGENIFLNKVLPKLKSDYLIYNILNTFMGSEQLEEPFIEELTTFIKNIYEAMTPLTELTDRFVESFYKKHSDKEEYNMIVNLINKRRQEVLGEARKKEDELEDDYELDGWNY